MHRGTTEAARTSLVTMQDGGIPLAVRLELPLALNHLVIWVSPAGVHDPPAASNAISSVYRHAWLGLVLRGVVALVLGFFGGIGICAAIQ